MRRNAPTIVAEALVPVPQPICTGIRAGPTVSPAAVARALAAGLAPAESGPPAPAWLRVDQRRGYHRIVAALERFGCACLADPVGSGKTYVALAAAAALGGARPVLCLVPAGLVDQWRRTAARLGVAIVVGSHEQLSRGRLSGVPARVVVIDESHHFRNAATRRYLHLAPRLAGRRLLLVTATPIVNRLADLAHQLRLGLRDDALAAHGMPSIAALLDGGVGHPALGQVVVAGTDEAAGRPRCTRVALPARRPEARSAARTLEALARLRLSRSPAVAALVRGVLLRAAASSPAALRAALRRYRRLLLHAQDAAAAGRCATRLALRQLTAGDEEQMLFWELLPGIDGCGDAVELDLDDLGPLNRLLGDVAGDVDAADPKVERLRELLVGEERTIVFVGARDTVRHLRDRLAPWQVAWCTGVRSGIGQTTMARRLVLDWFHPEPGGAGRTGMGGPRVLVTTDVAAEGLDLQLAGRIVHYDLPWTPMRLAQREGRAVRRGSPHAIVSVVRLDPPAVLERELRQLERLRVKARLPARVGLGGAGRDLWEWRNDLASIIGTERGVPGVALLRTHDLDGVLAGFALRAQSGGDSANAAPGEISVVGWLDARGEWSEEPAIIRARLVAAAIADDTHRIDPAELARSLECLAGPIRDRLRLAYGDTRLGRTPGPAARRLLERLHRLAGRAARARDLAALERLDRSIRFVAGGHTAGEARLVDTLAAAGVAELRAALPALPRSTPPAGPLVPRLTGLILFRSTDALLRSAHAET